MKNTKVIEKGFEIKCQVSLPKGKSYYECECPFCKNEVNLQVWSARTTGKRCACGSVLRVDRLGNGYAKRSEN